MIDKTSDRDRDNDNDGDHKVSFRKNDANPSAASDGVENTIRNKDSAYYYKEVKDEREE